MSCPSHLHGHPALPSDLQCQSTHSLATFLISYLKASSETVPFSIWAYSVLHFRLDGWVASLSIFFFLLLTIIEYKRKGRKTCFTAKKLNQNLGNTIYVSCMRITIPKTEGVWLLLLKNSQLFPFQILPLPLFSLSSPPRMPIRHKLELLSFL